MFAKNLGSSRKNTTGKKEEDSDGEYDPWMTMDTSSESDTSTSEQHLYVK